MGEPQPMAESAGEVPGTVREQMRAAHREILRRVFLGQPLNEIAVGVGLRYETVKFIARSPVFQAALAELQVAADKMVIDTAARQRMEQALVKGAEEGIPILAGVMKSDRVSPAVRSKVAFGFLDRVGLGPTRKIENTGDSYRDMIERLDALERRGSEPGPEPGQVTEEVTVRVTRPASPGGPRNVTPQQGEPAEDSPITNGAGLQSRQAVEFLQRSLGGDEKGPS